MDKPSNSFNTRTNEKGEYSFKKLYDDEKYSIQFSKKGFKEHHETFDFKGVDEKEINCTLQKSEESEVGILWGHVRSQGGTPLSGVKVSHGEINTVTDDKGYFSLSGFPINSAQTYPITFNDTSLKDRFDTITREIEIKDVENHLDIQLDLKKVNLKGKVVHMEGETRVNDEDVIEGVPLEGVHVRIGEKFDKTNKKGEFNISDIPPGIHAVTIFKEGYEKIYKLESFSLDNLDNQKTYILQGRLYEFKGIVRDEDDYPLKDVYVGNGSDYVFTDDEGIFSFYLPENEANIIAVKQDYIPLSTVIKEDKDKSIELKLIKSSGKNTVNVYAVEKDGKGVSNILVHVGNENQLTNENGLATFTGLNKGTYPVYIEEIRYKEQYTQITFDKDEEVKDFNLSMTKVVSSVSGKVIDNQGEVVEDADVYFNRINDDYELLFDVTSITQEDGTFKINYLPHGEYEVSVIKEDIQKNTRNVKVENEINDMELNVVTGRVVDITVVDDNNDFRNNENTRIILDDETPLEIGKQGKIIIDALDEKEHKIDFYTEDCDQHTITIPAKTKLTPFTVTLYKMTQNITLKFIDKDIVLPNVEIFIKQNERVLGPYYSNDKGECNLKNLLITDNTLYLNKEKYEDMIIPISSQEDMQTIVMIPETKTYTDFLKVKVTTVDHGVEVPVEDVKVTILGGKTYRQILTDDKGFAIFKNIDKNLYSVVTEKEGYVSKIEENVSSFSISSFTEELGDSTCFIQMEKGYSIKGHVLDERDKKPIISSKIELYIPTKTETGEELKLIDQTIVNGVTGAFSLNPQKEGEYVLKFKSITNIFKEITEQITLTGDYTINKFINLSLSKVKVQLSDNSKVKLFGLIPIPKSEKVDFNFKEGEWFVTLTHENGHVLSKNMFYKSTIEFENVPHGKYKVRLHSPGCSQNKGAYQEITVKERDTLVKFELEDINHVTLHGFVQDVNTLKPIPNARLELKIQGEDTIYETFTNREGYYFFSQLVGDDLGSFGNPPKKCSILVNTPNYKSILQENIELKIPHIMFNSVKMTNYFNNIFLQREDQSKKIKVELFDEQGNIILEKIKVICQGKEFTQNQGTFESSGFNPGEHWIFIIPPNSTKYIAQKNKIVINKKEEYHLKYTLNKRDEIKGLGVLNILGRVKCVTLKKKEQYPNIDCYASGALISCGYDKCETDDSGYYALFIDDFNQNLPSDLKDKNEIFISAGKTEYHSNVKYIPIKDIVTSNNDTKLGYYSLDFRLFTKYNEKEYFNTLRYVVSYDGLPAGAFLANTTSKFKNVLRGHETYIEKPVNSHATTQIGIYDDKGLVKHQTYPLIFNKHNHQVHFRALYGDQSFNSFYEGLVLDYDGYPVADARISIVLDNKPERYISYSNQNGEFYIVGKVPLVEPTVPYSCNFQIFIEKPGYRPLFRHENDMENIMTFSNYPFGVFLLEKDYSEKGSVSVYVKNKFHGWPLEVCPVGIIDENGIVDMSLTNLDGFSEFYNVPIIKDAEYILSVSRYGYEDTKIIFKFDKPTKEFIVDLTPLEVKTITGNVFMGLNENIPIDEAEILIGNRSIKTDSDGYFKTKIYYDESYMTVHKIGTKPKIFAINEEATKQDIYREDLSDQFKIAYTYLAVLVIGRIAVGSYNFFKDLRKKEELTHRYSQANKKDTDDIADLERKIKDYEDQERNYRQEILEELKNSEDKLNKIREKLHASDLCGCDPDELHRLMSAERHWTAIHEQALKKSYDPYSIEDRLEELRKEATRKEHDIWMRGEKIDKISAQLGGAANGRINWVVLNSFGRMLGPKLISGGLSLVSVILLQFWLNSDDILKKLKRITPKWSIPIIKSHENILLEPVGIFSVMGNVWNHDHSQLISGNIHLGDREQQINGFFLFKDVDFGKYPLTFTYNNVVLTQEIIVKEDTVIDIVVPKDNKNDSPEEGIIYEVVGGRLKPIVDAEVSIVGISSEESSNFQEIGDIKGHVFSDKGLPLPEVEVVCRNLENSERYSTTTNNDGSYSFVNLPQGNYQIYGKKQDYYDLDDNEFVKVQVMLDEIEITAPDIIMNYKYSFILSVQIEEGFMTFDQAPQISIDDKLMGLPIVEDDRIVKFILRVSQGEHVLKITHPYCEDLTRNISEKPSEDILEKLTLKKAKLHGKIKPNSTVKLIMSNGMMKETNSYNKGQYYFDDVTYGYCRIEAKIDSIEELQINDELPILVPEVQYDFINQ